MTATLQLLNLECALLCDDIRREENGKLIAIGIYGSSILMANLPGNLRLAVLARVVPRSDAEIPLHIRFKVNGDEVAMIRGSLQSPHQTVETVSTPSVPVAIAQEGMLEVEMSDQNEGGWQSIISMPVARMSPANP